MRKRRTFGHIKSQWEVIGGKKHYYRSMMEMNYAKQLEHFKQLGTILEWEHEPKIFYFEGIKRGVTNYTPDFRVTELDGTCYYCEVKGYFDAKSKTKVRRFRKYYPEETLVLYPDKLEAQL